LSVKALGQTHIRFSIANDIAEWNQMRLACKHHTSRTAG